MNSFRAVERALDYEAERQWHEWQETGRKLGDAPKQTRGWDDAAGVTRGQRSKEESSDYRYFPDPGSGAGEGRSEAGERRFAMVLANFRPRCDRVWNLSFGLSAYDADVLVNQGQPVVEYFLQVAEASGDGKAAANWVTQDVLRLLKERDLAIEKMPVSGAALADLIKKVKSGEVPSPRAREVFQAMVGRRHRCGRGHAVDRYRGRRRVGAYRTL